MYQADKVQLLFFNALNVSNSGFPLLSFISFRTLVSCLYGKLEKKDTNVFIIVFMNYRSCFWYVLRDHIKVLRTIFFLKR